MFQNDLAGWIMIKSKNYPPLAAAIFHFHDQKHFVVCSSSTLLHAMSVCCMSRSTVVALTMHLNFHLWQNWSHFIKTQKLLTLFVKTFLKFAVSWQTNKEFHMALCIQKAFCSRLKVRRMWFRFQHLQPLLWLPDGSCLFCACLICLSQFSVGLSQHSVPEFGFASKWDSFNFLHHRVLVSDCDAVKSLRATPVFLWPAFSHHKI